MTEKEILDVLVDLNMSLRQKQNLIKVIKNIINDVPDELSYNTIVLKGINVTVGEEAKTINDAQIIINNEAIISPSSVTNLSMNRIKEESNTNLDNYLLNFRCSRTISNIKNHNIDYTKPIILIIEGNFTDESYNRDIQLMYLPQKTAFNNIESIYAFYIDYVINNNENVHIQLNINLNTGFISIDIRHNIDISENN